MAVAFAELVQPIEAVVDAVELVFRPHRETQGTILYRERPPAGLPPVVGQLYVRKWVLERLGVDITNPCELTVTIAPRELPDAPAPETGK